MVQTTISIRMVRSGRHWKGILTLSGPGLSAPLDFYAQCDLRDVLGTVQGAFSDKETVKKANEMAVRKIQVELLQDATRFLRKNPKVLDTSNKWARDALEALERSVVMVSSARNKNAEAISFISSKYRTLARNKESFRAARMLYEGAKLLDTGRATLSVKAKPSVKTGALKLPKMLPLPKPVAPRDTDVEAPYDPLKSIPYPADKSSGLFQNFDPAVADY